MTKLKNKLWILFVGAAIFSAVFLFAGFTGGEPVSAEEACTHEYGEGIVHAPTCTAEGYTEYVCTLCGESYKDDFTDRAEHAYSEVVIEPTCTHEGYTTHFCTVCGYEYTDSYTPATGHTYQEATVLPTCTEEGYTAHTCLECGYSFNDTYVAALGHSYETEVFAPTCTEDGYTVYTCTVCEYTQIGDETAATGHAYTLNTVEATCVTYGYTEHVCANCSDRFVTDYIAALGHDYEDEVVPAEDGKIGYTKHTCRRCDYSYLSDFVTSGDDGYIGDEEHAHAYIFQMENDEEGQRLNISYLCECGKAYDGEMVILFTDAEGIGTVLQTDENGYADYSALNGTYRVTITDAEGELLADFELIVMRMPVHEIVDVGDGFRADVAEIQIVRGCEKNILCVFCKRFPRLQRVDHDAGINKCSHILFNLSSRACSKVMSAGITPNRDLAISTRAWNGFVSLDMTLPLRVIYTSSVAESSRYLLRLFFSSVAVIDILYFSLTYFVLLLYSKCTILSIVSCEIYAKSRW